MVNVTAWCLGNPKNIESYRCRRQATGYAQIFHANPYHSKHLTDSAIYTLLLLAQNTITPTSSKQAQDLITDDIVTRSFEASNTRPKSQKTEYFRGSGSRMSISFESSRMCSISHGINRKSLASTSLPPSSDRRRRPRNFYKDRSETKFRLPVPFLLMI